MRMEWIFRLSVETCGSALPREFAGRRRNLKDCYTCVSMFEDSQRSALEQISEILVSEGVEFIVVGGQAEWLFGSPRATFDVDLCYRRTRENLARLTKALKKLKPALRNPP